MNDLISFPQNNYRYDFSVPGILSSGNFKEKKAESNGFPGITYYLDDAEINGIFGTEISSLRLDWIDIAMAVYLADRLSLRDDKKRHKNIWKRKFNLKIGVRNLEIWQDDEIRSELAKVLHYFTDDEWDFDFVEIEGEERSKIIQPKLPMPLTSRPQIALFSGGLDSFAGAAQQLFKKPETPFVFISGATNTRQIYGQRTQIKELIKISPNREVIHHTVGFGIHWNKSEHPKEENSQRTRGFLFITLGAVTALNCGVNGLEIYENGIGAINLPYDASQIGTMSSRAVNPSALLLMEEFIEKISGQKFYINNPYLFQTKSEMCRQEIVKNLAQTTSETFSCDGFPVRAAGRPQCGICTSCLLRRLSLENAGLGFYDDGESYLTDLANPNSQPSFNQLNDLKAMEWQYQIIDDCLKQKDAWRALTYEYPQLQTMVAELTLLRNFREEELNSKILSLYRQYCAEWKNFSARRNFIRINKKAA